MKRKLYRVRFTVEVPLPGVMHSKDGIPEEGLLLKTAAHKVARIVGRYTAEPPNHKDGLVWDYSKVEEEDDGWASS